MGESPPRAPLDPVSIALYLDDDADPIGTYRPPANVTIDTTKLSDGSHVLHIHAVDATGISGVRDVPFVVANGPGITVTGLRAGSRVRGAIHFDVNAFGANEPFDPVRAESVGPIPAWTWVLVAIVLGWAAWYGLEYFQTPAAFAQTPTYAPNPALAAANAPATTASAPAQQSARHARKQRRRVRLRSARCVDLCAELPSVSRRGWNGCSGDVPGARGRSGRDQQRSPNADSHRPAWPLKQGHQRYEVRRADAGVRIAALRRADRRRHRSRAHLLVEQRPARHPRPSKAPPLADPTRVSS